MSRVIHFDIEAENPQRAAEFFTKVFGWKISKWEGEKWEGPSEYWEITTGKEGEPGINGGLMKKVKDRQTSSIAVGVDSIDNVTRKIEEAGGEIVFPKTTVPGFGYIANFKDPEGNVISIIEKDGEAK
jgi:predicted enzyme related to lactoylglutathione lyase